MGDLAYVMSSNMAMGETASVLLIDVARIDMAGSNWLLKEVEGMFRSARGVAMRELAYVCFTIRYGKGRFGQCYVMKGGQDRFGQGRIYRCRECPVKVCWSSGLFRVSLVHH